MSFKSSELYAFKDFRLDVGERLLLRKDERIPLPEKAFETLCVLVRQNGHLVGKDELLAVVWPDTIVEENNLDKNVSLLRRALGQRGKFKFIETVRGRGYRFVEDVKKIESESVTSEPQPAPIGRSQEHGLIRENTGANKDIGRAATVVALADWGPEADNAVFASPRPPSEKIRTSFFSGPFFWFAAIAAGVLAGLTFLGINLWNGGKVSTPIRSVAVLPFVNVGGDGELQYLSDGLSEKLIDRLSGLPQLTVIARSSSFKYRDENIDLQDVAQKLGVEAIITGRVSRRGDDLSIRVELIDARNNSQLWSEQFDRKAADALAIEGEIARTISTRLRLRLSGEQEEKLAKRGTDNPQAYDLLIKGDFFAERSATRKKALECYGQAIVLDPNYAIAYARQAAAYQSLASSGELNPQEVLPKVQAAAQKAVELDEGLADTHAVLAQLARDAWDWRTAENEYLRALELNPNLISARRRYSSFLSDTGRHDQAIAEASRLKELDPQQLLSHMAVPSALLSARRFDEAIAESNKILELGQLWGVYNLLGRSFSGNNMHQEAIAAFNEAIRLGDTGTYTKICLGATYARAGERGKAYTMLKQLEATKEYVSPGELPILYAALGEREKAFALLEKAYAARDQQLQHLNVDPGFDPIRDDSRFHDLLRRVGVPR